MPRRTDRERQTRSTARLSREAILATAITLADNAGLEGLSMRGLGQELGVNPMSLYHHVGDKETLLEAMLDEVIAGIPPVDPAADGQDWTEELRAIITAARGTMLSHPWAVGAVRDRQSPTPATLIHIERVLTCLRRGGCSIALCHHALHVLGSRILGFSQDLFDDSPATADPAAAIGADWAARYPHVVELAMAVSHQGGLGGCDDDAEFDFGLDLLIQGLEDRRRAEAQGQRRARL